MVRALSQTVSKDLRLSERFVVDASERPARALVFPRSRPVKLEVGALDVPVEELSPAVCFLPQHPFELAPRGEDEERPSGEATKHLGHGAVESPNLVGLPDPVAVRRVGHERAVITGTRDLAKVFVLETNVPGDGGLFGGVVSEGKDCLVAIGGLDALVERRLQEVAGFVPRSRPDPAGDEGPGLRDEAPPETGCSVPSDERGFDGKGAGATERIEKGPLAAVEAQEHEARGQRFLERCSSRLRSISPFVETDARRIDDEACLVLQKSDLDGEERAILGDGLDPMSFLQPLHDRFLYELLARGNAGELGFDGTASDRDPRALRQNFFPGDRARPVEELAEVLDGKPGELEKDPVGGAEP